MGQFEGVGGDAAPENGGNDNENKEKPQVETFRRNDPKVGPNDPCPCGSGKKFKKCCGA
jgi:preprotein translocase subunit SecA